MEIEVPETIVCVDCGGQCHRLTMRRLSWSVGHSVRFRGGI